MINIYEVGLSVTGINVTEIEDISLPTSYFSANSSLPVHSILPRFNAWFELSIEKQLSSPNLFLNIKSDGMLYLPEEISMVRWNMYTAPLIVYLKPLKSFYIYAIIKILFNINFVILHLRFREY